VLPDISSVVLVSELGISQCTPKLGQIARRDIRLLGESVADGQLGLVPVDQFKLTDTSSG
jgi:hypothetical protein